jgi:TonB-linked SusC/RagA family outer membrane protein
MKTNLIKLLLCGLLLSLWGTLAAQNVTVRGTVTDLNGALPGATIAVKGTTTATVSDVNGSYVITVSDGNAVLVFSFLGYTTQEIAVGGRTTVDVTLVEDAKALDEVIVVAFGVSKREAFTGSVGVVGSDNIKLSQQINPVQMLAGQVAGVQLSNTTGQFGASPSVLIRGFSSISSDNEPLYVVDGMPYDGNLNNINPADIETMTVLKDAASNALYGARGANGVIMITTKKAQGGKATITFDTKIGVNSVALKTYDYIKDPALWYETYYKSAYNQRITAGDDAATAHQKANNWVSGIGNSNYLVYTVPADQDFIGANGKINPAATLGRKVSFEGQDYWLQPDNWLDEGTKTGIRQEYNLSITGGDSNFNYLASVGYMKNEGITTGSSMDRFTARLKSEYQAKKWLRVGGNFSYTNNEYNKVSEGIIGSTGNIWSMVSGIGPIYPVYLRDGNKNKMIDKEGQIMYDFGDAAGLARPNFYGSNPIFANKYNKNNTSENAFAANGFMDINILQDLKLTINGGVHNNEYRYTSVTDPYAEMYSTTQNGGYVYKSHDRRFAYNLQQILNYTKDFGPHSLNVMAGHEYYRYTFATLSGVKTKMFSSDNTELDGAIIDSGQASSHLNEYNNEGYFFRALYDYADKLFFSGSFRRDASSRFAVENRWGNFWSLGGAWVASKEDWFEVPFVDMLKVKASVGAQGNDKIGTPTFMNSSEGVQGNDKTGGYLYEDQYNIENGNGEVSLVFRRKGNRNITWETNTNYNTGFEFALFNNRLSGTFDFFYRLTSDMLFEFFVSPSNGYTSYFDNIGDMRNRGIELDLRGDIIRTKDFVWNASFNITHVSNKILSLPEEKRTLSREGYEGYTWSENRFAYPSTFFFGENLPLYTFYTRKYAGVDADGKSMWYKDIKDANGNVTGQETTLVYAEGTDYLCGSALPKVYGGFGTTLQYKGFDVAVNFNYQLGGLVYDHSYATSMSSPSGATAFGGNLHRDLLDAWSPENTSSNIPRLNGGDSNQNSMSDRFLTKASFLNLQNINVGYTLPGRITEQIGISSVRVYVSMENVWYVSARRGLDPRYSFFGSTNNQVYSPIRTISGGLTVQF